MRLKADLTLFLVAILWGSAFAAQRIAAQHGSVYFFNGARFLLAALMLLPFALRTKLGPNQLGWMVAAGSILFVGSALQQAGLLTTSAGNAGFITSLYVVLVPVVIWAGWNEAPAWTAILAVVLAVSGAFLLSTGGQFAARAGDVLELAGAAFWALHVVVLGKFAARYEPVAFSAGQLFVGSALNFLLSGIVEHTSYPVPPALTAAIVYTAVFSLGLGYTLQIWGQRHTPPTDAAIILSLESVFAAVAGWLVLSERLELPQILGCLFILGAVVLSQAGRWGRIRNSTSRKGRI